MDLFAAERLPLVPEAALRAHKAYDRRDTRFRACARMLQSLRREQAGHRVGSYVDAKGRRRNAGYLLAADAAAAGANFIVPEVHRLVRRELAYREPGALIDDARLYGNLLSSMPLAFNLFGALKLDPAMAERWIAELFPDMAGKICHIQFEHSPARGDPAFTDDGTAFDVFISLRLESGAKAFLAFEVKYSESMTEPEARLRPRYDDLSATSGLYEDPDAPALRKNPHQQLWRQHMLAQAIVMNGLYDYGRFVLIAPRLNNDVQRAAIRYDRLLTKAEGTVGFQNMPLESAIAALALAGAPVHARALTERYTDFSPVHALI